MLDNVKAQRAAKPSAAAKGCTASTMTSSTESTRQDLFSAIESVLRLPIVTVINRRVLDLARRLVSSEEWLLQQNEQPALGRPGRNLGDRVPTRYLGFEDPLQWSGHLR